ncbi:MAG: FAD-binding protein [Coriobacteriia bacterium]
MKAEREMDRRGFIKVAAASGALLGAAGVLGGCSKGQSDAAADVKWDKEVQVLVVGSGTGAFAALSAATNGAKSVCILEKAATWGGCAAISGGGLTGLLSKASKEAGWEDSKDEIIQYYTATSAGRVDQDVLSTFIDNNEPFLEWCTKTLGWTWAGSDPKFSIFSDYYEPLPGWKKGGRGVSCLIDGEPNGGGGAALWTALKAACEKAKVEILLSTPAEELITDDKGAVIGVKASSSGKTLMIRADSIIMATGGFDHDAEMRKKYLPSKILATVVVPTNTGDGHKMGAAIGASLSNMDAVWGAPAILVADKDPHELFATSSIVSNNVAGVDWAMYRGLPGAVVVNHKGKRFANEAASYDVFERGFSVFDSGTIERVNVPAVFICDSACWGSYNLPGHKGSIPSFMTSETDTENVPKWFFKANSLEELADHFGIDKAGLLAEIEAFNANAAKGVDPVWHRGERYFDLNTTGIIAGYRTDIPNPVLAPLMTPPFYGAYYVPGSCSTGGGLTINGKTQVLNQKGEPIPNLYAAGNCSSGVSGGYYMHSGFSLGAGSVMNWVAARSTLGVK